ncbi:hypothetical protein Pst134EA_013195 [Puccinia striiformis f. sp. tritici]|uniref:Ferric oxidoreductase domain-containing protein n=3 Tax=Puccinia striiformis TaxID=27350 RepID=A0A0L0VSL9_9BASI|nr:hypothetical protein Pst134EA_013195 [Puccinia striiformis f. sp. tritici]KAI9622761.1 hypothetical protein H4Q26_015044 [Puccinia striiformis f. sp. tritici PST-130]KNF01975.1 hypothetical protein PSTG_04799 [Puccinia striiformis f. sp. tritici PST-78]POW08945.1 hypothetical protein PSHT_09336 [Puccinia striiformis]KAH9454101.1 hypothetical protein Pst134EB_014196 [Puccinia striiformis f. sp. tritici]KAH9465305.1 hypothetical protein Pst134EA_013195 [Puccinia striiformis f. sp. tritici]
MGQRMDDGPQFPMEHMARQEYNQNVPLSPLIGRQGSASPLQAVVGPGYPGHSEKQNSFAEKAHQKDLISPPQSAPKPTPVVPTGSLKFWTWFSPYRQILFTVVIIESLMILITLMGGWHWARTHLPLLVTGNLLVAIAIRSEWVMRLLYWISIKLFRRWTPLKFRVLVVAFLYHIGGLHSGCGISAMMWLILSWTYHIMNKDLYHSLVMASLFLSMLVLVASCFVATPLVRALHHNTFEITHRFLGWLGIVTSLIFVITSSWWDVNTQTWRTSSKYLIRQEEFWFLIVMIPLILGQWITVRNVPVTVDAPSAKASVIRVPGGLTSGLHTRVSRGGLKEWHIFGSISEGKHADCHYIVMAVQGGFTRAMNKEQPETLYTKTWKPCGLPYFSRLFNRGVAICTGSGIGAVGSTCIQHDDWFLIWIGADLEKTYGADFIHFIRSKIQPERLLIWDTKGPLGRPDVNVELERVYKSWNAQVALFIGSPSLNKSVLMTSRARGIPVFGSIWDA